jgi:predicted enzyme related to lactoylglutathione lyase
MIANTLSACIATEKVEESRDFYVKHFGAKVTFDCGWYVNLQIGKETSQLQFMALRKQGPPACNPAGLMYNFSVADVDAEHGRLTAEGLTPVMPLKITRGVIVALLSLIRMVLHSTSILTENRQKNSSSTSRTD